MIGCYERDGEIKIGDAALDTPSEREVARFATDLWCAARCGDASRG
jgi:hypothetical protein